MRRNAIASITSLSIKLFVAQVICIRLSWDKKMLPSLKEKYWLPFVQSSLSSFNAKLHL